MGDRNIVSIIVPVYNSEEYLKETIDSILNQTYKNIELILVNDGSKDNSGLICEEYAKNYNWIKVIHQKNSGPSAARNNGMNSARGKYIQFVDSDDLVEPQLTSRLVEAMEDNVQLTVCGYNFIEKENGNNVIQINPCIKGDFHINEFLENFGELYKENFINPLWNKLYEGKVIKNHNISFNENLNMGEDLLFNLQYFNYCKKVRIIEESLYNYLTFNNTSSLTGNFKKDYFENQQMLYENVRGFLLKNNCYSNKNENLINMYYSNRILECLNNLFHKDNNLTTVERKKEVGSIVSCCKNENNFRTIKEDSIQKRLIGYFINNESVNGVYCFFIIKNILQFKIQPLFMLLKTINNKLKTN